MNRNYSEKYRVHQYEDLTGGEIFDKVTKVDARYIRQNEPTFQDNKLIEALPSRWSDYKQLIDILEKKPIYSEEERLMDKGYRYDATIRLKYAVFPFSVYVQLAYQIDSCIRTSYIGKSIYDVKHLEEMREGNQFEGWSKDRISNYIAEISKSEPLSGQTGFTILGVSNGGKTTAIKRILKLYPQVIYHTEVDEPKSWFQQLVWLNIECSHDGTMKGLCYNFFQEVDRVLGTNYYSVYSKSRNSNTKEMLIQEMKNVSNKHRLGLLAIDEIQFLKAAPKNSLTLLNFFVHTMNTIGLPIVFIGNYDAYAILFGDLKQTGRSVGTGLIEFTNLEGDKFDYFLNTIWKYQWTQKECELTDEIRNVIFELTAGIPGIILKLYIEAQREAILSGKEEITPSLLKNIFNKRFQPLSEFTHALLSDEQNDYADYEDITIQKVLHLSKEVKQSAICHETQNNSQPKTCRDIPYKQIEEEVINYLKQFQIDISKLGEAVDIKSIINRNIDNDITTIRNIAAVEILKKLLNSAKDDKSEKSNRKLKKADLDKKLKELEKNIKNDVLV